MIKQSIFGEYEGRQVNLFTLSGDGLEVGVLDFGGIVQYIRIDTPNGVKDVVLGFKTVEEYVKAGIYCGAIVGRVANRISDAKFELNGKTYNLEANDGKNNNHSGSTCYDKRFFESEIVGETLVLSLKSADGDQGFPGNFELKAELSVRGKEFFVRFTGVSDCDTLWNPTYHLYFNLGGEEKGDVRTAILQLNAESYTPAVNCVPTGDVVSVKGTAFDFTSPRVLDGEGYDNNFVLSGENAATAFEPKSGISLTLSTDLPGLQLYTGTFLSGEVGKTRAYYPYDAFCLEPQFFPNAINTKGFIKPILRAGQVTEHYIKYEFSVK